VTQGSATINVMARTDEESLAMVIDLAKRQVIDSDDVLRRLMQRCVMVKVDGHGAWTYLDGTTVMHTLKDETEVVPSV
jgi:hypothetical protein